jgi:glycosyltransferase involved in cell wall biosynthesis
MKTQLHVPSVSFVVPCYNLAHLLSECLSSILAQTFTDFEVLVMDDCSPDATETVTESFDDSRIKYVRNSQNLGHLRNYNRGICLSRGRYVWLISADDYLRSKHALAKYVDVLERLPKVGYAFSAGFGVRDGVETRVLGRYSSRRDHDRVISGHRLLKKLLNGNFVLTPSGMVRRECYQRLGLFPLSMPWAGDWYLWSLFAMHYDVAYFAEPMLCYREHHSLSMTQRLTRDKVDACALEEIAISWTLFDKAHRAGYAALKRACLLGIASAYARILGSERYERSRYHMNLDAFESSLDQRRVSGSERRWIRARVYAQLANTLYWRGQPADARRWFREALGQDRLLADVYPKLAFLALGRRGDLWRAYIRSFR